MTNFDRFGLSKNLNRALLDMDFRDPTPIQSQAIPVALEGKDILGSAVFPVPVCAEPRISLP